MWVLIGQGRHSEAEAEGQNLLRELTRIKHLVTVWELELSVLGMLAWALCELGRHDEAEAIARGNLPRADGASAAPLHCCLVRILNGQGRSDEALGEARQVTPPQERSQAGHLDLVTATALYGLGRHSEAAAAARRALADCEAGLHPSHPRLSEIRTLLARLEATG
nr:tetratricopeptide repeat protein [Streptomyces cupreus]